MSQPAEYGPDSPPRPAIWLLADADTKIYLFGTFHLLPRGFRWRTPLLDDIIRRSDELVVEVTQENAVANIDAVMRALQLGKAAPLLWRVSPSRREALQALVESLGVPIERFDGLQTWAAGMTISVAYIARQFETQGVPLASGDSVEAAPDEAAPDADGPAAGSETSEQLGMPGVESVLEREFRSSGRPISGVETAAQQMAILGSMSFAEQRQMLEAMADAFAAGTMDGPVEIGNDAWARGDVDSIAQLGGTSGEDLLYEALLPRRNAAWTEWLEARLARPGTLLFAVGAAHLAGPDSVQTMLASRGIIVRRIQ
jgi:uncharacterized protein YbaP (TraB family)